ncbi:MAG: hypothetical protein L3J54_13095, partial [Draconibacterium sp.]|nr:hypothetical protein [Draconibacterium sp.]
GITIILVYFLLTIFIYYLIVNWTDKSYIKKLLIYHSFIIVIVTLFSSVLILSYFQISPFLSRFGGLPIDLAQKHPFSIKSVLSFILPMATGNDAQYFGTDTSMSNGYWGIISLILFIFSLTKKAKNKESYLILFLGVFSLFASFGSQFFLRELLYNFAPLMDMFKYPSIFRAFAIFSFLAFIGINLNLSKLTGVDRKKLQIISALIIGAILFFVWQAVGKVEQFAFFNSEKTFADEILTSTRFDNIIFQGLIQIIIVTVFMLLTGKAKTHKYFSAAILFLFISDGIISTQLNIYYTVVGNTNPIEFSKYLKSSPKGFPVPELNPIEENSDKNARNDFIWMNNNVFPKRVTFDGLVAFKLDGYMNLADNHPDLLNAIKKEAVVYFSDDIRKNSSIDKFKTNTVFFNDLDYNNLSEQNLRSDKNDQLNIIGFSPTKIEIKTKTSFPELLTYQQNFYKGWAVYIDGVEQNLLNGNFAHMAVFLPSGEHIVVFKYANPSIKIAFYFGIFILLVLAVFYVRYFITDHPHKKNRVVIILVFGVILFILISTVNRYFYGKNKLGLTPVIIEKVETWKAKYGGDIQIFLSTQQQKLKSSVAADKICFISETTNISELSYFLMNTESKYFAFAWQGSVILDEIFELIYSFYPTVINQEKGNNSGVILLEKSIEKQNYTFIQTFEPENSAAKIRNDIRIKIDSVSGNHSYYYNADDEWGTTAKIPLGKEFTGLEKITILVDFLIEKEIAEIPLVFSIERDGEPLLYQVSKIDKFAKDTGQWTRAVFTINVEFELNEGDLIIAYLWNKNKIRFQIDNLKIKISHSK